MSLLCHPVLAPAQAVSGFRRCPYFAQARISVGAIEIQFQEGAAVEALKQGQNDLLQRSRCLLAMRTTSARGYKLVMPYSSVVQGYWGGRSRAGAGHRDQVQLKG